MTSPNNASCLQYKVSFSATNGAFTPTAWRCKNAVDCDYCRSIEINKIRRAMNEAHATAYIIKEGDWAAYRQKIRRDKKGDGYIKIPQSNGMAIVYSLVAPQCDHEVIQSISDEQILANRLDKSIKGRATRTGVFSKKKDKDDNGEAVEIKTYFPLFRYKESGKIMPYHDYLYNVIVTAYRKSPFTTITKDNAEGHLRYVSNYIISIMMLEPLYAGKIEPLVKVGTRSIPVVNFDNWVDGADVKMSGVKNSFDNPTMQLMDDLLMNGEPPFDWVGYCLSNGLVYDSDKSKSYYESERALEEGDKQILEMVEKLGAVN